MLDIVISFDTTGSMGPAIAEVRRKVDSFINTLFDQVADLHMAIVAHGDYCDFNKPSSYLMTSNINKLTDNRRELSNFVRTVPNTNGCDSDEAYEYVLEQVATFNWRESANKVFILIGDADPHEVGYNYSPFTVRRSWRDIVHDLIDKGIKIYPVQALNNAKTQFYNILHKMSGTPHLRLAQFSNITQLLTAITYKQQGDDKLQMYGQQLQENGELDRSLAYAMNLLLNAKSLIGGIELSEDTRGLKAVPAWRFQMLHVDVDTPIKDFVNKTGAVFKIGRGFYELTKSETVQENKEVVLRDNKGDMYTGDVAREMIGLPYGSRGTVRPMRDLGYTVFIQSTSPNRKLIGGTRFLYEA